MRFAIAAATSAATAAAPASTNLGECHEEFGVLLYDHLKLFALCIKFGS
jgi:hypothetical protein